jgi:hypothetical protein
METEHKRSYSDAYMDEASKHMVHNKTEILESTACTCFYCGFTFNPQTDLNSLFWTDTRNKNGKEPTGCCPSCQLDFLIGSASGFPVTDKTFLLDCSWYWMNGYNRIVDDFPPEEMTWVPVDVD